MQVQQIENFSTIVTVEDHLMDGGFGSWLLESAISQPDLLPHIRVKALNSKVCGMVAKQSTLNAEGGLTTEALCKPILSTKVTIKT